MPASSSPIDLPVHRRRGRLRRARCSARRSRRAGCPGRSTASGPLSRPSEGIHRTRRSRCRVLRRPTAWCATHRSPAPAGAALDAHARSSCGPFRLGMAAEPPDEEVGIPWPEPASHARERRAARLAPADGRHRHGGGVEDQAAHPARAPVARSRPMHTPRPLPDGQARLSCPRAHRPRSRLRAQFTPEPKPSDRAARPARRSGVAHERSPRRDRAGPARAGRARCRPVRPPSDRADAVSRRRPARAKRLLEPVIAVAQRAVPRSSAWSSDKPGVRRPARRQRTMQRQRSKPVESLVTWADWRPAFVRCYETGGISLARECAATERVTGYADAADRDRGRPPAAARTCGSAAARRARWGRPTRWLSSSAMPSASPSRCRHSRRAARAAGSARSRHRQRAKRTRTGASSARSKPTARRTTATAVWNTTSRPLIARNWATARSCVPGLPIGVAVQLGHLVGADHHGVRRRCGRRARALARASRSGRGGRRFAGQRRLVDVGRPTSRTAGAAARAARGGSATSRPGQRGGLHRHWPIVRLRRTLASMKRAARSAALDVAAFAADAGRSKARGRRWTARDPAARRAAADAPAEQTCWSARGEAPHARAPASRRSGCIWRAHRRLDDVPALPAAGAGAAWTWSARSASCATRTTAARLDADSEDDVLALERSLDLRALIEDEFAAGPAAGASPRRTAPAVPLDLRAGRRGRRRQPVAASPRWKRPKRRG